MATLTEEQYTKLQLKLLIEENADDYMKKEAAAYVEGVINLRGKVVAIVNLRTKLGLEKAALGKSSRILITQLDNNPAGLIVDAVSGVAAIDEASITCPDEVLKDAGYLTGVAKIGNRLILIADIERLLSAQAKMDIRDIQSKVQIRKREA